jgi:hypothetical protein
MKILLPADGSACSLRAVDQLIAHIDCLREVPEIHLLHVHLPIPIGRVQAHVGKETLHAYYLEEGSSNCRQRSRNSMRPAVPHHPYSCRPAGRGDRQDGGELAAT